MKFFTGCIESWTSRPMNSAINTATTHQCRISSINDGVNLIFGNITALYFNRFSHFIRLSKLLPDIDPLFWSQVHAIACLNVKGLVELSLVLRLNVGTQLVWRMNVN